ASGRTPGYCLNIHPPIHPYISPRWVLLPADMFFHLLKMPSSKYSSLLFYNGDKSSDLLGLLSMTSWSINYLTSHTSWLISSAPPYCDCKAACKFVLLEVISFDGYCHLLG